jgi:hypothetical protein
MASGGLYDSDQIRRKRHHAARYDSAVDDATSTDETSYEGLCFKCVHTEEFLGSKPNYRDHNALLSRT